MAVQSIFTNQNVAAGAAMAPNADGQEAEDCTPAVVLVDLGICGMDGWMSFREDGGRLVECQEQS